MVNVGDDAEKVGKFVEETGWDGRVIRDSDKKLAAKFMVIGYPTTVLLTSQCQLVVFTENEIFTWFILGGRKWDDPQMIEFFKKAAAQMELRPH